MVIRTYASTGYGVRGTDTAGSHTFMSACIAKGVLGRPLGKPIGCRFVENNVGRWLSDLNMCDGMRTCKMRHMATHRLTDMVTGTGIDLILIRTWYDLDS